MPLECVTCSLTTKKIHQIKKYNYLHNSHLRVVIQELGNKAVINVIRLVTRYRLQEKKKKRMSCMEMENLNNAWITSIGILSSFVLKTYDLLL